MASRTTRQGAASAERMRAVRPLIVLKRDNLLLFPDIFRKSKRRDHGAEATSRWWRNFLKKFPNLQIELCGYLDPKWPPGKIAKRLHPLPFDGYCIRITCTDKHGKERKLGRTRLYEIQYGKRTFYIFGDTLITEPLKAREQLHDLLIAFRILVCWLLDVSGSQVFWPAGKLATKAKLAGFVEVSPRALETAPAQILEIARRSKKRCPELLTGMLRLSDKKVPKHLRLIKKSVKGSCVVLRGKPSVKIPLGPVLEAYFQLMFTKISEERNKYRYDGRNDGC